MQDHFDLWRRSGADNVCEIGSGTSAERCTGTLEIVPCGNGCAELRAGGERLLRVERSGGRLFLKIDMSEPDSRVWDGGLEPLHSESELLLTSCGLLVCSDGGLFRPVETTGGELRVETEGRVTALLDASPAAAYGRYIMGGVRKELPPVWAVCGDTAGRELVRVPLSGDVQTSGKPDGFVIAAGGEPAGAERRKKLRKLHADLLERAVKLHGIGEAAVLLDGFAPWEGASAGGPPSVGVELRRLLLPYLYSHASSACLNGIPLMRPVFFHFAGAEELPGAYMLGPDLLVVPEGVEGPLPCPGEWSDIESGERYELGVLSGSRARVLARPGSLIPFGSSSESCDYEFCEGITARAYSLHDGVAACCEPAGRYGVREAILCARKVGRELEFSSTKPLPGLRFECGSESVEMCGSLRMKLMLGADC